MVKRVMPATSHPAKILYAMPAACARKVLEWQIESVAENKVVGHVKSRKRLTQPEVVGIRVTKLEPLSSDFEYVYAARKRCGPIVLLSVICRAL